MSSWKDYPQIFANGKFEFVFRKTNLSFNGFYRTSCLTYGLEAYAVEDCKLIARPISDMSDEEIRLMVKINSLPDIIGKNWFEIKEGIIDDVKDWTLSYRYFLHLLSIGIYPFDDDADVIWRYENE